MVPPDRIDFGLHRSDSYIAFLELALFFFVILPESCVVLLESYFDVVNANVKVFISIFKLPASEGEVFFHLIKQLIILG
jgi:hypothetical protein